jgi:hypothetical protein
MLLLRRKTTTKTTNNATTVANNTITAKLTQSRPNNTAEPTSGCRGVAVELWEGKTEELGVAVEALLTGMVRVCVLLHPLS